MSRPPIIMAAPTAQGRIALRRSARSRRRGTLGLLVAVFVALQGCTGSRGPLPTVSHVDLERFMGPWYVLAHIPADSEKNAYDGVETYRLAEDGSIETTYVFREGGHDGPERRFTPRGFVRDRTTNATWGMQFVWPLRLEYLVAHVDADYRETIIARTARDYVWIMARRPDIAETDYARLVGRVAELGYDVSRLRRVPHRDVPSSEGDASRSRTK
ncbi:MAG: lipocalin family protein [Myxococcota bacterium]